jgi:hypothetical protein
MLEYKAAIGALALVLGAIGYVPYFRDLIRGTTKPHVFSWFVWGLLGAIAFAAQIVSNGGWGAWTTGFMALVCFVVAFIALFSGEKNITRLDWFCFAGALIGTVFWAYTKNPVTAVVIITIVDLVAFVPTFRKSYAKPDEETVFEYGIASLKYVLAIVALESYSLTTWLYPASLVITNGLFVVMSLIRRKQLSSYD